MKMQRPHFFDRCARLLAVLVMLCLMLAACGNAGDNGMPTVTYTYASSGVPKDLGLVQNAINAILAKEIHVQVKLNPIDWAAYDQKMQLAFSAHQQCDIVFTAPWINNYYTRVTNHNYLPLDDMLKTDAPELYDSMTPAVWQGAAVNGKIYGVINQQLFPKYWGFAVRKDLAEKYNLDVNTIKSISDLSPYLAQMKTGEPELKNVLYHDTTFSANPFHPEIYNWDTLGDNGYVAMKADDPAHKVFAIWETPEYKQMVEQTYQWYKAGYYPKTPPPVDEGTAAFQNGKSAVHANTQWRPESTVTFKNLYNHDFVGKSLSYPAISTGSVSATLSSICRTSQHPHEAMKVLNEINTNVTVYNLLAHGIEGKHWVWVDKGKKLIGFPSGLNASTDRYWPGTDWLFGSQFNAYYTDPSFANADLYAIEKKYNQQAEVSTAMGFAFDQSTFKTQLAQLSTIGTKYTQLLEGTQDPAANWDKFIQEAKQAGLDQLTAEYQRQIDAWAKMKG